jgi:hypothetical protein
LFFHISKKKRRILAGEKAKAELTADVAVSEAVEAESPGADKSYDAEASAEETGAAPDAAGDGNGKTEPEIAEAPAGKTEPETAGDVSGSGTESALKKPSAKNKKT